MLIDISDLEPKGLALDDRVELDPFRWNGEDVVECEPIHVTGTIVPARERVELTAELDAAAYVTCTRCLRRFGQRLEHRFRLYVVPAHECVEDAKGAELATRDDPDGVEAYPLDGNVLDLAEVLREQLDLLLPFSPRCQEECRGLCVRCGAELNREACRCEAPRDDRRSGSMGLDDRIESRRR